jgi:hypothetical protein
MTVIELKALWGRFLGTIPSDAQFDLWVMLHSIETVHRGILKTIQKNLAVNGMMSDDHKIRFASKVMNTRTFDPQKAEGQSTAQPTSDGKDGQCAQ